MSDRAGTAALPVLTPGGIAKSMNVHHEQHYFTEKRFLFLAEGHSLSQ